MTRTNLYSAVLLAAAIAVAGCDFQKKSVTAPSDAPTATPAPVSASSLLGTWTSVTSVTSPVTSGTQSCANFTWTIASQTSTDVSGSFTALCLGTTTVTGTGTGHLSGSTVAITVTGNGAGPGLPSCPYTITGTGTIDGDLIHVPYSGSTCLGPLSGTQTLQRSLILPTPNPAAPALQDPADGVTVSTRRPTLVVGNVAPAIPSDVMQYGFELATDAGMSNRVFSVVVDQGSSQTAYTAPDDLAYGTRYYWHAKTIDAGHSGAYSSVRSFVTPNAPAPITPPAPPSSGPDMSIATILNSPADLASWPVTTTISRLELRTTGVHVEFSKQDGPDRWPDVFPPGWNEPLQYTLGMCMNVSGKWYCSAVVQFWYGLDAAGGGPAGYATNWFYDPIRWGPMSGHQPAVGETIGFFVCAGDCRNNTSGSGSVVKERSNVVLVPMPSNNGATFTF